MWLELNDGQHLKVIVAKRSDITIRDAPKAGSGFGARQHKVRQRVETGVEHMVRIRMKRRSEVKSRCYANW